MKKLSSSRLKSTYNMIVIALISILIVELSSCKWFSSTKIPIDGSPSHGVKEVSWNAVFKTGSLSAERNNAIIAIEDSVKKYYIDHFPSIYPEFHVFVCPCDTLLYNININFIDGSGTAVTPPPPPKPGPNGSGDYVDVLFLANNIPISDSEDSFPVAIGPKIGLNRSLANPTGVLAVIDTGIDTTVFMNSIGPLIWKESSGEPTMFNFLPGQIVQDLRDDHNGRHGTVVTAFALQAVKTANNYPQIMVLKALDERKRGTTFSVSCAMSYAIQKNASIINASLGYYGDPDPVLEHYIQLCALHQPNAIPVFAAAGNVDGTHDNTKLCLTPSINNRLGVTTRLFFPACFSREFNNLFAVTSLNQQIDQPCYYQNYSNAFVTLGVLNMHNCCAFEVNFLKKHYEGTSFATPIAAGSMIDCMIRNSFNATNTNTDWNTNIIKHGASGVTLNGNYILENN
ncbi:MAG: S8 family serine peptidase [Chitinophagaceae bacterium]